MILALDLDGTLLRTDKTISPRTDRALDDVQRRGHRIVVATARPPRTTEQLLDGRVSKAPRVYYTGAIVAIDNKRVHYRTIDCSVAQSILNLLNALTPNGTPIFYEIDDHLFTNRRMAPHQGIPVDQTVVDLDLPLTGSPVKIVVDLRQLSDTSFLAELPSSVRHVVADGAIAMIMPHDVSKAAGVSVVLDRWSATFDHVIAIGDDLSDMDLIEQASLGVAMDNGHPDVKAMADRIAPTNDDDGVAMMLEQLIEEGLLA